MPVTEANAEYAEYKDQWELVADCVEGGAKIKAKKTKYLPKPNVTDVSSENEARYTAYLTRASFQNVTGRTKNTLVGAAFRKDLVIELPKIIEYIIDESTKDNMPLINLIKKTVGEVLEKGRYGLLVEYPPAPPDLTEAQVKDRGLRAFIATYEAENIINWRMDKGKLSLVVLKEGKEVFKDNDIFTGEIENEYRALRLIDGLYVQEVYDKGGTLINTLKPQKSDGSQWDEIPFVFIGSENNDSEIDPAPLFDMAAVNIAHYRNSADYEESLFLVGQPTPVITGLSQSWWDENFKNGMEIGSRAVIPLPVDASASLLQASPNIMPIEGMKHKEEQMVALGARLISPGGQAETAEAVRMKYTADNSVLSSVVSNTEAGYKKAIGWIGEYMGVKNADDLKLAMNKEFFDTGIDAQTLTGLINLVDRQLMSIPIARGYLRQTGLIPENLKDEEIDAQIEAANPIGSIDQGL